MATNNATQPVLLGLLGELQNDACMTSLRQDRSELRSIGFGITFGFQEFSHDDSPRAEVMTSTAARCASRSSACSRWQFVVVDSLS
ncbi:hypothetical protein SynA1825c_00150 [Synechococcus sp. A18-25c]|nr:hypothetical protein SynA1825c_00150 [Synechococcus sp. A18-25c]